MALLRKVAVQVGRAGGVRVADVTCPLAPGSRPVGAQECSHGWSSPQASKTRGCLQI